MGGVGSYFRLSLRSGARQRTVLAPRRPSCGHGTVERADRLHRATSHPSGGRGLSPLFPPRGRASARLGPGLPSAGGAAEGRASPPLLPAQRRGVVEVAPPCPRRLIRPVRRLRRSPAGHRAARDSHRRRGAVVTALQGPVGDAQ